MEQYVVLNEYLGESSMIADRVLLAIGVSATQLQNIMEGVPRDESGYPIEPVKYMKSEGITIIEPGVVTYDHEDGYLADSNNREKDKYGEARWNNHYKGW